MIRILRRSRVASLVALGSGLLAIWGCVTPLPNELQVTVEPQVTQSAIRFRKEYVLAPGDQIEVLVRRVPEVSRTIVIRPDGNITLPIINEVAAAGLTIPELTAKLTERFGTRLTEPDVTIIALQVRQPVVYVTGDVGTSAAVVPFRDAPTAMQAITFAGGFRRSAAARDVTIIRLGGDGHLLAVPVVTKLRGQAGPYMALRQTLLQPDDIVFVPENGRSQVARILEDFVTRPLAGINAVVGTYVNFRFIEVVGTN